MDFSNENLSFKEKCIKIGKGFKYFHCVNFIWALGFALQESKMVSYAGYFALIAMTFFLMCFLYVKYNEHKQSHL